MTSGLFLERLANLTEILSMTKPDDDYYHYHIRIIVMYFFEQCLIGKRTKEERVNVTP